MNLFHHEEIYRGKEILDKIKVFPICVCGIGAIGSNLVENLVRQEFQNIFAVDKDRIEDRNINTQIWTMREIGFLKVQALKNRIFQVCGKEIVVIPREIKQEKDLKRYVKEEINLMIDAFDNSKSRRILQNYCSSRGIECLHIGFSSDYGEIIWNEDYRVPDDKGRDDCDYPLARNLILLLVAIASEIIIKFIIERIKENYTITLKDFGIEKFNV